MTLIFGTGFAYRTIEGATAFHFFFRENKMSKAKDKGKKSPKKAKSKEEK